MFSNAPEGCQHGTHTQNKQKTNKHAGGPTKDYWYYYYYYYYYSTRYKTPRAHTR